MSLFNLEDQLTFYGSFHHNKWNQLIHIVFVPLIAWSAMIFLVLLTPGEMHSFYSLDEKDTLSLILPQNGINLSLLFFLGYATYYMILEFWPGLTYNIFLFFLYHTSNHLVLTSQHALSIGIAAHVLSWYMQIHPGHLILEKRRPALTNSFFQSLVLAPIFTFYEILFTLGFKKRLYDKVTRRINANIRQFKAGVPFEQQTF